MSHLSNSRGADARRVTPPEWVPMAHALTRAVSAWSGRTDVTATISGAEDDGTGAPAYFDTRKREVVINAGKLGLDNPDKIIGAQPVLLGVACHEAAHARWSRFPDLDKSLKGLSPRVVQTFFDLEESRIEGLAVDTLKHADTLLRAAAQSLIVDELRNGTEGMNEKQVAAKALLLTEARVTAGSLRAEDVTDIYERAKEVMDDPSLMKRLRAIWTAAQAADSDDPADLIECARDWVEALGEDPDDPENDQNDDADADAGQQMADAMAGQMDASGTEQSAVQEADAQPMPVNPDGSLSDSDDQGEGEEAIDYGPQGGPSQGGPVRIAKRSAPTVRENAAVRQIAAAFRKVMRPERVSVHRTSVLPGGKLLGRQAVNRAAEKAAGIRPTAEPWRQTHKKTTPHPPVTLGILTDTSGSMSAYMPLAASLAWAIPKAAETFGAKSALVYFGDSVAIGLKVGQRPAELVQVRGEGGSATFGNAWKALQTQVDLLSRTAHGHRVIVVISDCELTSESLRDLDRVLAAAKRDGVKVIIAGPRVRQIDPHGALVIQGHNDLKTTVDAICKAVVSA